MNKENAKPLSELSNEKLWRLFPIILSEYNDEWPILFEEEAVLIRSLLPEARRIRHIGSTSITGLIAKPTIDILLEVDKDADIPGIIAAMEQNGYIYAHQPNKPAPHGMFMKGYTPEGFKGQAYHAHLRYMGDWEEIHFRDYLREHPEAAAEYADIKRNLALKFEHDRDAYTDAKGDFVRRITELSRE